MSISKYAKTLAIVFGGGLIVAVLSSGVATIFTSTYADDNCLGQEEGQYVACPTPAELSYIDIHGYGFPVIMLTPVIGTQYGPGADYKTVIRFSSLGLERMAEELHFKKPPKDLTEASKRPDFTFGDNWVLNYLNLVFNWVIFSAIIALLIVAWSRLHKPKAKRKSA